MTANGSRASLLVVDDERIVHDSLGKWFREEGYEIGIAESAREALQRMAERHWDAALVDIKMPGTDGIELQRRLKEIDPELAVIIMTGYASVETAVQALKNGAYDYVTKPFDPDDIAHVVHNALEHRRMARENVRLKEAVAEVVRPPELVGQSTAMKKVFDAIETVGPTDATVLVTGDSGTGKELVARAIHAQSPRRFNPLVAIHCGALTETLLESELFGHEKGAFTGAQYRKKGKFEIAEGGTVFLDEIGDISLKTQTDLLRVLQEREIARVGGNQPIKVDFRCVAATNKRLETADRGRDVPARPVLPAERLSHRAAGRCASARKIFRCWWTTSFASSRKEMNKTHRARAPAAMYLLQQYDWPGNVRELENAVERAMVVAQEPELREQDFTLKLKRTAAGGHATRWTTVEKAHILKVLEECGGNQTRAAEVLDIDRVTLHNKLKKYGWKKAGGRGQMNVFSCCRLARWMRRLLEELRAQIGGRVPRSAARCCNAGLSAEFAFHAERGQYHSTEILARMQQHVGPELLAACWASPRWICICRFSPSCSARRSLADAARWSRFTGCGRSSTACLRCRALLASGC